MKTPCHMHCCLPPLVTCLSKINILLTKPTFSSLCQLGESSSKFIGHFIGGGVAEWLGCWTCNLVVPGSSPPLCNSLDLFSVAPNSTPWLRFVNSQLVCLLPVGIFNHFMFIYHVCFPICLYWP